MSEATTADQQYEIKAGSIRNISVDCRGWLDEGESLTGTPTVTITTAAVPPTLDNKIVSGAVLIIDGESVPIGKAIQFRITTTTGTTLGGYTITVSCGTDASPAQTPMGDLVVTVVA